MYIGAIGKSEEIGRFNAAFFFLFFLANPTGNIITGLLFLFAESSTSSSSSVAPTSAPVAPQEKPIVVLWVLFAISVAGALMLLGTRYAVQKILHTFIFSKSKRPYPFSVPDYAKIPQPGSFLKRIKASVKVFAHKRILFFMPYMLYSGFQLGYNWGVLPTMVPLRLVPWIFVCYGVAQFSTAPALGRMYDRFKWKALLFINIAASAGAFILVPVSGSTGASWPMFIATAYFGIIENSSLTFVQSSLLDNFPKDPGPALGSFRVVWALGIAAGFLVQLGVNYVGMTILTASLCAVSTALVVGFELHLQKKASLSSADQA